MEGCSAVSTAALSRRARIDALATVPHRFSSGYELASGSVDGTQIRPRRLHWERFVPHRPNGKTVLIAPGYQETGRSFRDLTAALLRKGYQVVTMDQQWAGKSEGKPGQIDRGLGITRDVAWMAALAQKLTREVGGRPDGEDLILLGNSMGGGPGVFSALLHQQLGLVKLDGAKMPTKAAGVLTAPYFGTRKNMLNDVLGVAADIPGVGSVPVPYFGVPPFSFDPEAMKTFLRGARAEDIKGQLSALEASLPDLERLNAKVRPGALKNHLEVVMSANDSLADPAAMLTTMKRLGSTASVDLVKGSRDHCLQTGPNMGRVVAAVDRAAAR